MTLILTFLLCAGTGGTIVLELISRRRQLLSMLELIRYLRREIRLSGLPLNRLFSSSSCPKDLPLLEAMNCDEPFDLLENYRKGKALSAESSFFSPSDWEACDVLFSALGQGDLEEQERRLAAAEEYFSDAAEGVRRDISGKGRSALVLGCSVGAVLVLILM